LQTIALGHLVRDLEPQRAAHRPALLGGPRIEIDFRQQGHRRPLRGRIKGSKR